MRMESACVRAFRYGRLLRFFLDILFGRHRGYANGDMLRLPVYEGTGRMSLGGNGLGSGRRKCGKRVIRMNPIIIQPVAMNTL